MGYLCIEMENEKGRTLVMGASPNPSRYSHMAVVSLDAHGFEPVPLGKRKGDISGYEILTDAGRIEDIDTVTMYLSAKNQEPYYRFILEKVKPRRIIFNPGAENPELARLAAEQGIEVENACTLVLLASRSY